MEKDSTKGTIIKGPWKQQSKKKVKVSRSKVKVLFLKIKLEYQPKCYGESVVGLPPLIFLSSREEA
mgnify:CR=1 FL=1